MHVSEDEEDDEENTREGATEGGSLDNETEVTATLTAAEKAAAAKTKKATNVLLQRHIKYVCVVFCATLGVLCGGLQCCGVLVQCYPHTLDTLETETLGILINNKHHCMWCSTAPASSSTALFVSVDRRGS